MVYDQSKLLLGINKCAHDDVSVKTKIVAMGRCLVADIQVEVFAERRVVLISIDVLAPTIQELVQVIEVVLLPAFTTMGSSGCIRMGHSLEPAIVMTNGGEKVAIIFVE